jgi:hypothetical protein
MDGAFMRTSARLPLQAEAFYRTALIALKESGVPFLVGGGYALVHFTGILRYTKDLDIFIRAADLEPTLAALAMAACNTEVTFPHWLAKAYRDSDCIDVIFSSGNGLAVVDDEWFEHASEGEVLGLPLLICPAEETIWSKSFIVERERYDGADVAHILRSQGPRLAWQRILRRFGDHWRVLLSHLVMYGFIYPGERDRIPAWVMQELVGHLGRELAQPPRDEHVCQGTLLSRQQYLVDVHHWGYADARLRGNVRMTPEDIALWTAAIKDDTGIYVERQEDDPHRCRG